MRFNESMELRSFFLHYKTIEHPANIHTYTLTQGQTQRDVKGTAFLPEVFVLSASLCCCCRVHLLHTILFTVFSILRTTHIHGAAAFRMWSNSLKLLEQPIEDIGAILQTLRNTH
jgi:hypothetical protein